VRSFYILGAKKRSVVKKCESQAETSKVTGRRGGTGKNRHNPKGERRTVRKHKKERRESRKKIEIKSTKGRGAKTTTPAKEHGGNQAITLR